MEKSQVCCSLLIGLFVLSVTGCSVSRNASNRTDDGAPVLEADVVVYGGTSAGVIAAYTAKQYGHSVLLVTPKRHVGGLSSGGLGMTDIGDSSAITGLSRDFYRRLGEYYGKDIAWRFEPHAAEQVFEQYLDRADVEVLFSGRVTNVTKRNATIERMTLEYAGEGASVPSFSVAGNLFIDASYEGDLLARAGVSYTVGREANDKYGERHNGVQMGHPRQFHQFPDGISPFKEKGNPDSGLLPEINGWGVEGNGTADDKVQAYNFRMCLCKGDQKSHDFTKPASYDPERYELLARVLQKEPWPELDGHGFLISEMPNGKTDWNNKGPFSTDYIGKNWAYPEASYEKRKEIWQEHKQYQQGLMYFLSHNEQVPDHIRKELQQWGYCRDEFLEHNGWPHALYVREARRMVGVFVMTDPNIMEQKYVDDGIAFGSYQMDSHNVQRVVVEDPNREDGYMVKNEGDVQVPTHNPYPISYRSLLPKPNEATNLLVPVALSASHIAFGSIRMEPVFMMLGQAAGVAGDIALEKNISVQQVEAAAIQQRLHDDPLANGGAVPEEAAEALRFDPDLHE